MLTKGTIEGYKEYLFKEIGKRKQLGGYSPDAATLETLCLICFDILQHIEAQDERRAGSKKKKLEGE